MQDTISYKIHLLRDKLVALRSDTHALREFDRLHAFEGLCTIGIQALYHLIAERKKVEIMAEDREFGPSLFFNVRGIGSDQCPGCFVCGGLPGRYSNISAFVDNKEQGEQIVSWFQSGARLDYRYFEPNRIQVKIGACKEHLVVLESLSRKTEWYNRIRSVTITDTIHEFVTQKG